jgi:hypothetical protein
MADLDDMWFKVLIYNSGYTFENIKIEKFIIFIPFKFL